MFEVIIILVLLYMFTFVLNYSLLLAYFQRSGPKMWLAQEPARMAKDVKFSIAIALSGFVGTLPIFLYITEHTARFTGTLLIPSTNRYWKAIAHEQHERHQQIQSGEHQAPHWSDRIRGGRDRLSIGGHSHRFRSYSSGPPAPPRRKLEKASNNTDGRCKSIWD